MTNAADTKLADITPMPWGDDTLDYYEALVENLRETSPAATEPGVYRMGKTLYQVVIIKTSGQPYAKQEGADGKGWEYAKGVIYNLKACDLLTLEQAKAIGKATGVCACCHRHLSDEVSVVAGIGPVCEKKWYGSARRSARKVALKKVA